MKPLKTFLDMELLNVDWKNIINVNMNTNDSGQENEENSFLFV